MKPIKRLHMTVTPQYLLRMSDDVLLDCVSGAGDYDADGIRDHLRDEIAAGVKAYPIGDCDNWDAEQFCCKGHPVTDSD